MRKLISTQELPHDEWLKIRKKGIGGSDIAAVCGFSPYKSALACYIDKTDQAEVNDDENIPAELGLELEPFMSKKFEAWILKNEGLKIELQKMQYILQDDEVDYFLVNLDRFFQHPDRGFCPVEIKTTTEFKRDSWTEDEVPTEYYTQCQWQLMITKAKWCYLIVLIGNRSIKVYVIPRNENVIIDLRARGKDFWENFVTKSVPPAPDGSDSSMDALRTLYPEEYPESVKVLEEEEEEKIHGELLRYDDLNLRIKELKRDIEAIKQTVISKIGDAELMMVSGRKVTYKTISVEEYTVKANSYRKLLIGK